MKAAQKSQIEDTENVAELQKRLWGGVKALRLKGII